jgi:hypothetical protein
MEAEAGPAYEQGMVNHDFLRRAFELAESGDCSSLREIRAALIREGFSLWQLSQLSGKQLARQLRAKIAAAKKSA